VNVGQATTTSVTLMASAASHRGLKVGASNTIDTAEPAVAGRPTNPARRHTPRPNRSAGDIAAVRFGEPLDGAQMAARHDEVGGHDGGKEARLEPAGP
jgi:hypothetical protein